MHPLPSWFVSVLVRAQKKESADCGIDRTLFNPHLIIYFLVLSIVSIICHRLDCGLEIRETLPCEFASTLLVFVSSKSRWLGFLTTTQDYFRILQELNASFIYFDNGKSVCLCFFHLNLIIVVDIGPLESFI